MTTTSHIGMTLVEQSQAQKEVTVNEALTRIDALLNNGAKSRSTSTPPGSPATGDLYIIGGSPTGAWTGYSGKLAYFDQVWRFIIPNEGMMLWVADEDSVYIFNGSNWYLQDPYVIKNRVVTAAGSVTVTSDDYLVIVNKTVGAATTVNLPSVWRGRTFVIKDGKGDAATNNITITPASGTIDGAAGKTLNSNYQSATLVFNGSEWNSI